MVDSVYETSFQSASSRLHLSYHLIFPLIKRYLRRKLLFRCLPQHIRVTIRSLNRSSSLNQWTNRMFSSSNAYVEMSHSQHWVAFSPWALSQSRFAAFHKLTSAAMIEIHYLPCQRSCDRHHEGLLLVLELFDPLSHHFILDYLASDGNQILAAPVLQPPQSSGVIAIYYLYRQFLSYSFSVDYLKAVHLDPRLTQLFRKEKQIVLIQHPRLQLSCLTFAFPHVMFHHGRLCGILII